MTSPTSGQGVLKLPTDVPEMYDLKLTVKRLSGKDTFAVRLVAQGRSFLACIDAHERQLWCGLDMLDDGAAANGLPASARSCSGIAA